MHIVCPHCSTAYAIGANALGQGRTVRCSRCKETWLARPEDAFEAAPVPAVAAAGGSASADVAAEWDAMARAEADGQAPVVASPPIAGDWVEGDGGSSQAGDWQTLAREDALDTEISRQRKGWFPRFGTRSASRGGSGKSIFGLPAACAAMGALVLALLVWRIDVVRLMPQTASLYKMIGLDVNLRGLVFKDVKVTTESVEGKSVLVIEGVIVGETGKTVEIPRLRFSVRDAQGAEIYAWNTVLEQTVLKPGDHALFRSRLASPPAEGKSIDIRFFNKRDIASGSV